MSIATASRTGLTSKLREHFGFRRFRPGQERVVRAAIEGRDTLVIMPTGSGKSLCFQLPALALEGTTVVVSPLIALMKDQADALRERGIRSSRSTARSRPPSCEADEAIARGRKEFVYTTPERLANPEFRDLLRRTQDRPVRRRRGPLRQPVGPRLPARVPGARRGDRRARPAPVLALTATATPDVIDDILRQLRIPDAEVVHTGFYRPNLHLGVVDGADEDARRERCAGCSPRGRAPGSSTRRRSRRSAS